MIDFGNGLVFPDVWAHGPPDEPTAEDICEHAGHEWGDAGGGLLICLRCEAEEWA